ncbi:MAG TPA: Gfo/Idh/MocA family oxidoreductase [Candidatus Atribacteria bacterium]|nr:Gfo/Idh/MocA family oxidoreductase [Candidatus Atribacteria bacterium]
MIKLRIGIIGCGRISQAHIEAANYLKNVVEIVALSDKYIEKAKDVGSKIGVNFCVDDYRKLLANPKVDAVIIALPHNLHYEAAIASAKAKKHILLEKPMALKYKEAKKMVTIAKDNDVFLMIGHSRRFCDAIQILREKINEIGPIIRILINFLVYFPEPPTEWWKSQEETGDLITYLQASHSIDFALWILNKTPIRIFGNTFTRNNKGFTMKDEADIFLEFPGDITTSIHLSLNTKPPLHEYIIVGEKGSFRLIEYQLKESFTFGYKLMLNEETLLEGVQIPTNYSLQLKEFVEAIKLRRVPLASGEEILPLVKVLEKISESSKTGEILNL